MPLLVAAVSLEVTPQAVSMLLAASVVYAKGPGRRAWRRQRNRRLHPARTARLAAMAGTIVAGAAVVVGMAATTEPRPPTPRGVAVTVEDPDRLVRRATFVLYDPVPGGADSLAPVTLSGASF